VRRKYPAQMDIASVFPHTEKENSATTKNKRGIRKMKCRGNVSTTKSYSTEKEEKM
jgi:hypothetical protein